ncbi:bifunctional UDP-N-acetylmuramoyl-tripeptide:D-alanyl-D-alanine ligase/alanine racemase [Luteibaculum oceani]|uniref:Alanine racemase n=1 Tax=Luteibaculum oceani TaxID=1294296 RepID=A0A5C6V368_9FLAO|nr:bifunctional UDP-N-acetylmuramoyl-tripeptide:D-alanyl-D-alanine ligase/alanine racemase [Luteibaculum oceani]TXC78996.1 bifunctional UDP-N-acetylmuramoyl-tripeptide:D-alanyl-D-alanine ligase/alanine racemase [Luteibaculum oceani]
MFPIASNKLKEITGGFWYQESEPEIQITTVFTDTRKIYSDPSAIYIALEGPNYNGHAFVKEAYNKGIRLFIVSEIRDEFPQGAHYLRVKDTLFALHQWAVYTRNNFHSKVIGVTGSNGKTMFKEWFAAITEEELPLFRNPKSFNSQVGVPLSILPLDNSYALGVFEAGISKPGEMEKLERLIKPHIGVFTHLGSAHDEGFQNREEKFREKIQLFKNSSSLILPTHLSLEYQDIIKEEIPECEIITVGSEMESTFRITTQIQANQAQVVFHAPEEYIFKIPFSDKGSVLNCTLAIVCYLRLKLPVNKLQERLSTLRSIPMRQQYSRTLGNAIIINDAYSLDVESLQIALEFLDQQAGEREKCLIISDFAEPLHKVEQYARLVELVKNRGIQNFIGIGPDLFQSQPVKSGKYYPSTKEFLHQLQSQNFNNQAVLVKGGRKFQLEKVVQALQTQRHQTTLEINLSAIVRNYNALRLKLSPNTKIMAMVKAAGYGGGIVEVGNMLKNNGVDYIGVAFTQEGIALRKAGIQLPILVLNPWLDEAEDLIEFELIPSIYRMQSLFQLDEVAKSLKKDVTVHLKLETGMNRLGMQASDVVECAEEFKRLNHVRVKGIYSHLAAADEEDFNDFTREQVEIFNRTAKQLESILGYRLTKHIANTAGALRFPEAHFDMVRFGIGLYGYNPTRTELKLELAMQFKSSLSQIKILKKGESAGYSRKYVADKETRIGILPVGYADGLPRSSGNQNFSVLFPEKGYAPIIGNVCMDMCMIDLGDLDVSEGDVAVIFGHQYPISILANANHTIAYEILCRISDRVKRVYYED